VRFDLSFGSDDERLGGYFGSSELTSERFVSIDADTSIAEGRSISNQVAARYVIVDEHDDEEDRNRYYILDEADLHRPAASGLRTLRDYVRSAAVGEAHVLDLDAASWSTRILRGAEAAAFFDSRALVRVGGVLNRVVIPPEALTRLAAETRPESVEITPSAPARVRGHDAPTTKHPAPEQPAEHEVAGGDSGESDGAGGVDGAGGGDGSDEDNPEAASPQLVGLRIQLPQQVLLGDVVALLAQLVADAAGLATIPVRVKPGEEIAIVVQPRNGFELVGSNTAMLTVPDELISDLPALVKLRASATGEASVVVYAFRGQIAIGSITVTADVVESAPQSELKATELSVPNVPPGETVQADLSLVVMRDPNLLKPTLDFVLTSKDGSLNLRSFGPHTIDVDPVSYFADAFHRIDADADKPGATAREQIRALGATLFEKLLPSDLREVLWQLRARITTVIVQTNEPWVPWEMCLLSGTGKDGAVEEAGYFCELFQLTRWIPQIALHRNLTAKSIGVVAPRDAGLPAQEKEVEMLEGLSSDVRQVVRIPATTEDVIKALSSADFDVIHFSGHGTANNPALASTARLELSGSNYLSASSISGTVRNLGRRSPLVFLNACQLGRQSMDLHGLGGWASAMLDAGAAAFVGTHWNATDELASQFAQAFYKQALADVPIGEAVHAARQAIRDQDDPTWLAYAVYSLPGATVETA
jgi:CHAT domain